jgi:hypothetical protein
MTSLLLRSFSLALLATVAGSAGCMDSGEEEDGIDDSFVGDGKSDAFGIAEGSPEALGVLAIVRNATREQLDNDAMLSSNTAKAIVNHRQGGDRVDGTDDDNPIDSLTELDKIPYVGPMAFELLLDFARANNAIPSADPFSDTFCGLDRHVTMGQFRDAVGTDTAIRLESSVAGVRVRTRVCVTPDNCPAWQQGASDAKMFMVEGAMEHTVLDIPAAGLVVTPGLSLATDGRPVVWFAGAVQVAEGTTTRSAELSLQCYPAAVPADDAPLGLAACHQLLDDKFLDVTGTDAGSTVLMGEHCAQMIIRRTELGAQREVVFFARY